MSIVLYRKGNTHTEFGIECEVHILDTKRLRAALHAGFVTHPKELIEETNSGEDDKLSSQQVRDSAKEAGIEDWDKKRIGTLKAELCQTPK